MKRIMKLFLPIIMCLSISFTSVAEELGTYLSEEIQATCVKYGEEYGICPELIMAIIERESSGQVDVESGGCKGLMQIYTKFHTDRMKRLGVTDIYDVDGNIHVGAEQIIDMAINNIAITVDKEGRLCDCNVIRCFDCAWSGDDRCREKIKEWSEQEYVEPTVDWSKVPTDAKIMVRNGTNESWTKRHFAKYENKTVYAWNSGTTSYTVGSKRVVPWKYAKLTEEDKK